MNAVIRQRLVPAAVLSMPVWLLVGCAYVPWFEQRSDRGQTDLRPLVVSEASSRQLRVGEVPDDIVSRLGLPMYTWQDGRSIGYSVDTFYGCWVAPLCFAAAKGIDKSNLVRFDFDQNGEINHDEFESSVLAVDFLNSARFHAMENLNARSSTAIQLNLQSPGGARLPIRPNPATTRGESSR